MFAERDGDAPGEEDDHGGAHGGGEVRVDVGDADLSRSAVAAAKRAEKRAHPIQLMYLSKPGPAAEAHRIEARLLSGRHGPWLLSDPHLPSVVFSSLLCRRWSRCFDAGQHLRARGSVVSKPRFDHGSLHYVALLYSVV